MTAVFYSLLITLGLITSASDFDNVSAEEQQEMINISNQSEIVITDYEI